MKVTTDGNTLFIELPIDQRPSASGKTIVVASSRGNKQTEAVIDGQNVIVGVNAYIYPK